VLVIRERFGDAEPAHHLERDRSAMPACPASPRS
jgi:hypothetical protein